MGVVCKALDEKLDRYVALKFLSPAIAHDEILKRRLLQEAKAASALDHPNVGAVYSIEETPEGEVFIVMAYYEGETLNARLQHGPIPLSLALFFTSQILRGLAAAHAKAIVHRDIKPSNVIVTPDGNIKILDFGLAKTAESVHLTSAGTTVGTAAYMSPEQALGEEATAQSDIWSTGIVLYQMLSGHLPFNGPSQMSMLYQIAHEPPQPLDPSIPDDVRRIVTRALAKSLADRYLSAAEMLRDLQAAISGTPIDSETRTLVLDTASLRSRTAVTATAPVPAPARRRILPIALAAILVAVAIPSAARFVRPFLPAKWFPPAVRHLAVLPFRNIGNDPADAALCDGLQEILSSRLAGAKGARNTIIVVPAGEIRRRNVTSASDAWKQFGAALAVEGVVMRSGQGLQMTVNLVDAEHLTTLDSAVLKDPVGDFAALADTATQHVAELVSIRTGPAGANTTPAASESYIKGTGYLARYDKPGNLDSAIREFQNAISQDPRFELAYAGLAEASRLKFRIDKDPKWIKLATDNATQAINLNNQLAPAYVTLGRLHDASNNSDLAIQELTKALTLEPLNSDATLALGTAYDHAGRPQDAEKLFRKSIDLRPENWEAYNRLAAFYAKTGRYTEADAQYRKAIQYAPDNYILYINFGANLQNLNKRDEARNMYRKSIELNPNYPSYSNLGVLDFEDGRYAEAAASFEKALKLNDLDYHLWANLAGAYEHTTGWDAKARSTLQHAADLAEKARLARSNDVAVLADLATYNAKLGHQELALTHLRQARALAPDDVDVLFWTSEAYEEMGRRDDALDGLRLAFAKGLAAERVDHDPEFQKLRSDPRFLALLRK